MERKLEGGLDVVAASEADGMLVLRHAARFGIAVHEDWQGRGVGTALMTAMIDTADRWFGILRTTLRVFTDNAAAIALYEKMGFQREGLLRADCFRDGDYVDAYVMNRLSPRSPRNGHIGRHAP